MTNDSKDDDVVVGVRVASSFSSSSSSSFPSSSTDLPSSEMAVQVKVEVSEVGNEEDAFSQPPNPEPPSSSSEDVKFSAVRPKQTKAGCL